METGSDVFSRPRRLYTAAPDDAKLGSFELTQTAHQASNDAALQIFADAHLEGDQLLWYGPAGGTWLDTTTGELRATFSAPNPLDGSTSRPSAAGAATFLVPPTKDAGEIAVLFAQTDGMSGIALYHGTIGCAR